VIFGFDVLFNGRLLVYSYAGLLQDQTLVYGDNQFLLEIESLDLSLNLYFIHAGGYWFFTGISGYVVRHRLSPRQFVELYFKRSTVF
jgi:hypothetical protein